MSKNLKIIKTIISLLIIIALLIPLETMGISLPKLFINEALVMDTKYIIIGVLFIIYLIIDFIFNVLVKKEDINSNNVVINITLDKIIFDATLIILSSYGFIHCIIPVIVVISDIANDAIRIQMHNNKTDFSINFINKLGKVLLSIGVILTLFYNLPFELFNLKISDFILILASIFNMISTVKYYNNLKHI